MIEWNKRPRPVTNQSQEDVWAAQLAFMRQMTEGASRDDLLMALYRAYENNEAMMGGRAWLEGKLAAVRLALET